MNLRKKKLGPSSTKLTTSLANDRMKFQGYYAKALPFFAEKNERNFCIAKVSHIFSAKKKKKKRKEKSSPDFKRSRRLNKSLTNRFVKLTLL